MRAVTRGGSPGGRGFEGELVLALHATSRLVGSASRPGVDWPPVEPADLVQIAEELDACSLVLVTFVADHELAPGAADVAQYEGLRVECEVDGVDLLDHLLMSRRAWRSVAAVSLSADPDASTSW